MCVIVEMSSFRLGQINVLSPIDSPHNVKSQQDEPLAAHNAPLTARSSSCQPGASAPGHGASKAQGSALTAALSAVNQSDTSDSLALFVSS